VVLREGRRLGVGHRGRPVQGWEPVHGAGDKIGRVPATQFLLRRKTFEGPDRRDLPAIVAAHAGRFESTPFDSLVAAVSTLGANAEHHLADFEPARAAGSVE